MIPILLLSAFLILNIASAIGTAPAPVSYFCAFVAGLLTVTLIDAIKDYRRGYGGGK